MTATPTIVYGAADAKISPLISDSGSAPVYGAAIDVPGIQSAAITGKSDVKELMGDEALLASVAKLKQLDIKLEFAMLSPEILAILTGAELTTNEDGSWDLDILKTSDPGYFKLELTSADTNAGQALTHTLWKVKATDFPDAFGLAQSDFKNQKVTLTAIPLMSNHKFLSSSKPASA